MNWIIIAGLVTKGLKFYGPFSTEDEAILWASEHDGTHADGNDALGVWELAEVSKGL